MDASQKIIRFNSYEAMLEEIRHDMSDGDTLSCRYPVRFILLNNFVDWKMLALDLAKLGVQPLNLEEMIEDKRERWITTDELICAIKGQKVTAVVSPLSELVRFYSDDDFHGLFNEIILTEDIDNPKKRIYIPLIGLQNRFSKFLNEFARIEESAPIWAYLTEEQRTKVFLTTIQIGTDVFEEQENIIGLNTLYDWLRFWKTHAPIGKIICSSAPIIHREKSYSDNIFTFEHIESYYDYIDSFLGVTVPFDYKETEKEYWHILISDIIKYGSTTFSFSAFVSARFGFSNVTPKDLFTCWTRPDTSPYDRWLLKNYFLYSSVTEKYHYLKVCLEELSVYESRFELTSKIVDRIFYFTDASFQNEYATERELLMRLSPRVFVESVDEETKGEIRTRIIEIEQDNMQLAIALTTGVFDFEKSLITAWYADREHSGLKFEKLRDKYPALGMYLSDFVLTEKREDNWFLDYLDAYRNAKLSDTITERISSFIAGRNHDGNSFYGWYHSFVETHNLLCKHQSSENLRPDKVYWVDALGAEFLPYLLSFIKENGNGYYVVCSEITRCTIPSATAQNRFDDVDGKFDELDNIAHDSKGYKKNSTLVRELGVLGDIIEQIINRNAHGEHTIAIVSDHGLSCLSRLADSKKYDAKVKHEGRYFSVDNYGKKNHDADYVDHVNENDGSRYKIALTHSSLGHKPIREVHGGCTPEEVLVPYVVITNKRQELTDYKYFLDANEITVSDPVISVGVMPQPPKVVLSIGNNEYVMKRTGNKWSARVDGLAEGKYRAEFTIPNGTPFNETIQVIGTGFDTNDYLNF